VEKDVLIGQRSRVFSLVYKAELQHKLLKFSLNPLLTNENSFLTFDLFGLLKHSPFPPEPFNYVVKIISGNSSFVCP